MLQTPRLPINNGEGQKEKQSFPSKLQALLKFSGLHSPSSIVMELGQEQSKWSCRQNDRLLAWLQTPSLVKFSKSHEQSWPSKGHILFRFFVSHIPFSTGQQSPPSKLQILMLFSMLQTLFPIAEGFGQQSLPSYLHSSLKFSRLHWPSSINEWFLHGDGGSLQEKLQI